MAVYGTYLYLVSKPSANAPVVSKPLEEQQDISHVYNKIAKTYDSEIGTSEIFMGMPLLRRAMAKRATVWFLFSGVTAFCTGSLRTAGALSCMELTELGRCP